MAGISTAVTCCAILAVICGGTLACGEAAVATQRIAGAADTAALAAADTLTGAVTGKPCERAAEVAQRNGTELASCTTTGFVATIEVRAVVFGISVTATARAGPASSFDGGGMWIRVSDGGVTSGFGARESECTAEYCASSWHEGLDFSAGCGSPIFAASAGIVSVAGENGGFGNQVQIDHGDGIVTGYAHMQPNGFAVAVGDVVAAGDVIGFEGATGNSFGCHVHFTVAIDGAFIDPAPFVTDRGVVL